MEDFVFFEIEFGNGVEVEKEVLGKPFKLTIHGSNASIKFPQVLSSLTQVTYSNEKYLVSPAVFNGNYGKELDWGMVTSIDKYNEIEVFVRRIILVLPFANQTEGEKIISKMEVIMRSIELFRQYLSIYTKESFAPKYYATRPKINYITKNEVRQKLDKKFNEKFSSPAYASTTSYKAIDSSIINDILDKVSKLEEPPLPFQLLDEARKLFYQQKYRSTVFECSASVELLLRNKIEEYVKSKYSDAFKQSLLRRYVSLEKKYDLASFFNLLRKEYDIKNLAKNRNEGIHEGKTITRKQALESLKIAEELIYTEGKYLYASNEQPASLEAGCKRSLTYRLFIYFMKKVIK